MGQLGWYLAHILAVSPEAVKTTIAAAFTLKEACTAAKAMDWVLLIAESFKRSCKTMFKKDILDDNNDANEHIQI